MIEGILATSLGQAKMTTGTPSLGGQFNHITAKCQSSKMKKTIESEYARTEVRGFDGGGMSGAAGGYVK